MQDSVNKMLSFKMISDKTAEKYKNIPKIETSCITMLTNYKSLLELLEQWYIDENLNGKPFIIDFQDTSKAIIISGENAKGPEYYKQVINESRVVHNFLQTVIPEIEKSTITDKQNIKNLLKDYEDRGCLKLDVQIFNKPYTETITVWNDKISHPNAQITATNLHLVVAIKLKEYLFEKDGIADWYANFNDKYSIPMIFGEIYNSYTDIQKTVNMNNSSLITNKLTTNILELQCVLQPLTEETKDIIIALSLKEKYREQYMSANTRLENVSKVISDLNKHLTNKN